jgi:hypothetical protein
MGATTDDPFERLLDLVVYAPIGALSSLIDAAPDLAAAGRQRTAAARMFGRFAIDGADARVGERLDDARRHVDEFLRLMNDAADRSTRRGGATGSSEPTGDAG